MRRGQKLPYISQTRSQAMSNQYKQLLHLYDIRDHYKEINFISKLEQAFIVIFIAPNSQS